MKQIADEAELLEGELVGSIGPTHKISENDFCQVQIHLREQLNTLSGRLYQLTEALGLSDKQERATKALLKREIWERFDDFVKIMEMYSATPYKVTGIASSIPSDDEYDS